jgi:hypothetical protein
LAQGTCDRGLSARADGTLVLDRPQSLEEAAFGQRFHHHEDAARHQHARSFGQGAGGVRDMMQGVEHHGPVEASVRKRQGLARGRLKPRGRHGGPGLGERRLAGVDPGDRRPILGQPLRQGSRAASDIEDALARQRRECVPDQTQGIHRSLLPIRRSIATAGRPEISTLRTSWMSQGRTGALTAGMMQPE